MPVRVKLLSAAFAAGAILLSSGGAGAACEPHKIDVGGGKFITSDCSPLRIAFIGAGSNNTVDTCLALLFLKRANLAKDLTIKINKLELITEDKPPPK